MINRTGTLSRPSGEQSAAVTKLMKGLRVKQIQQFIVGTIGIAHIDEQGDFSTAQGTEVHLMWIGEHFECSF